jgi:hypothetical protein
LHVLGTPPAFVLSQDQTLQFRFLPEAKYLTDIKASMQQSVILEQIAQNSLLARRDRFTLEALAVVD